MSKLEETHESGPRKKKRVTRQLSVSAALVFKFSMANAVNSLCAQSQVSKIYEEMENSFKLEERLL